MRAALHKGTSAEGGSVQLRSILKLLFELQAPCAIEWRFPMSLWKSRNELINECENANLLCQDLVPVSTDSR